MKNGILKYQFVAEFEQEENARRYEALLINQYKQLGLAKFNKKRF